MPKPTVSIVIPAYNEEQALPACLEACINQETSLDEILVIDNNSTDKTADIVRAFQANHPNKNIKLFSQFEEQGITPTRNLGFDVATGDIIGRIDADSIIAADWTAKVRQLFEDTDSAASTGPVYYYDMPANKLGLKADNSVRRMVNRIQKGGDMFLLGSNMAITKSAWNVIKHMTAKDEANLLHEDIDLALCLIEAGFTIQYNPKMISGMSARRIGDSPRRFFDYVMRFERTYKHHNMKISTERTPIFVLLSIYFPLKLVHVAYDPNLKKLSWSRLKESVQNKKNPATTARHY